MDVESIIEPLRNRAAEIEDELNRLRQELVEKEEPLKVELKKVTRILRAADPPVGPRSGPKSERTTMSFSGKNLVRVMDYLKENYSDPGTEIATQKAIGDALDVRSSELSDIFKFLRQEQFVRFVRQGRGGAKIFALDRAEVTPTIQARIDSSVKS